MKSLLTLTCAIAFGLINGTALAQSAPPLVGEGIGGYLDKERRNPVVTVSVERGDKAVTLLADAYVPNNEYAEYPVQFEFFVNRKLFATQIRSKALPGPVGVDIGADVASPPFNYTIIGKVIHPNREFTTVIEGAVFPTNLVATMDCTLTLPAADNEDGDSDIFTENNVTTAQSGANLITISLTKADNTDNSESVSSSASLTVAADNSARGSLTYVRGKQSVTVVTEGTITMLNGTLSAIAQISGDGSVELKCS